MQHRQLKMARNYVVLCLMLVGLSVNAALADTGSLAVPIFLLNSLIARCHAEV